MSEGPIITGRLQLKDETGTTLTSIKNKIDSAFSVIAKAAMVAGAAAAAGIGLSIKSAADFEVSLTRIVAASGKAGEEADALKAALSDAAKTMGPQFGISATSAVDALESLVKAGLKGEDAVTALQGALQLAALEGLGTAEASGMLVQAMTMFSLKAENATHVIDLFSAASDAGIDSAGGYASGLANVGATAASMGLSMEETMAALVQLDNTFGGAQESGTFLNRMLLDMAAKADDAGLELYNVDGSMKSLDEIMGQVRRVLQGFGGDQQAVNEWLGQFDTRAQKAILGLSGYSESISDTEEDLGAMQTAQDKVNMVLDTFAGRMKTAGARIQEMSVSLGERLMPYAENMLTVFEGWMPVIGNLIDEFGTFTTRIFDVAGALAEGDWGAAFDIIERTYSGISGKFVEWFSRINWGEVWGKAKAFLGTLYSRFVEWAGDIASFFVDWWGTINWAAVWGELQSFTVTLFDKVEEWAGDIARFFVDWWNATDWDAVWGGLRSYASTLWERVKKWAGDIGAAFLNWFGAIEWPTVFSKLSAWMDGFYDWLFGQAAVDIQTAFSGWVASVDWLAVFKSLGAFAVNLPLWIATQIIKAPVSLGAHMAQYIAATDWGAVFSAIGDGVLSTLKGAAETLLLWMPDWLKKLLGLKGIETPPQPKGGGTTKSGETTTTITTKDGEAEVVTTTTIEPTPKPELAPFKTPPSEEYIRGGAYKALASGFEGLVTKPTSFLAGEAGPEYVSVTPRGQPARSEKTVVIRGPLIQIMGSADEATARLAADLIMKTLRKY